MLGIELGLYNNLGFLKVLLFDGLYSDRSHGNSIGVVTGYKPEELGPGV
jgi:hypothetical protein